MPSPSAQIPATLMRMAPSTSAVDERMQNNLSKGNVSRFCCGVLCMCQFLVHLLLAQLVNQPAIAAPPTITAAPFGQAPPPPQTLPAFLPSGLRKCAIQECQEPCFIDQTGTVHECCGFTHAMELQRRKAIQQRKRAWWRARIIIHARNSALRVFARDARAYNGVASR